MYVRNKIIKKDNRLISQKIIIFEKIFLVFEKIM